MLVNVTIAWMKIPYVVGKYCQSCSIWASWFFLNMFIYIHAAVKCCFWTLSSCYIHVLTRGRWPRSNVSLRHPQLVLMLHFHFCFLWIIPEEGPSCYQRIEAVADLQPFLAPCFKNVGRHVSSATTLKIRNTALLPMSSDGNAAVFRVIC